MGIEWESYVRATQRDIRSVEVYLKGGVGISRIGLKGEYWGNDVSPLP